MQQTDTTSRYTLSSKEKRNTNTKTSYSLVPPLVTATRVVSSPDTRKTTVVSEHVIDVPSAKHSLEAELTSLDSSLDVKHNSQASKPEVKNVPREVPKDQPRSNKTVESPITVEPLCKDQKRMKILFDDTTKWYRSGNTNRTNFANAIATATVIFLFVFVIVLYCIGLDWIGSV